MKSLLKNGMKRFLKLKYKTIYSYLAEKAKYRSGKSTAEDAVVIQGPIMNDEQIMCIKAMSFIFKDAYLIVSTWKNTDDKLLEKITPYIDCVIENTVPDIYLDNRNLQIVSTAAGIEAAQKAGMKYVMKTRTDVVIGNKNIFKYYKKRIGNLNDIEILKRYGLKNRLMIIWPRVYYYYRMADFFMLGHIQDMYCFWDSEREIRDNIPSNLSTVEEYLNNKAAPEEFLSINFAKKINYELAYTLNDNFDFFKEFFYVVNGNQIKFRWIKDPIINIFRFKIPVDLIRLTNYEWNQLYKGKQVKYKDINIKTVSPIEKISKWKYIRLVR